MMKNQHKKPHLFLREWALWAVALFCIAIVFYTGILDKQKVWSDLAYYHNMQFDGGQMKFDLGQGDTYGVHNQGPWFDLPKGTYQLKIRTFADGDNEIHIVTKNNAAVEPKSIQLHADEMDCIVDLKIGEPAEDLEFLVDFQSGTKLEFVDIRIYSPKYKDHAFTFAFVLLAACGLYSLWKKGYLTAHRRSNLILLTTAVLLMSAPSLKDHLQYYMDTEYHIARVMNLVDGLQNGCFPVRIGGFTYNGYGAITSVFYPDFFLYPMALMILGGASIQYAMNTYLIALHAFSGITMYVAAKKLFRDSWIGTCAAVLYVCSIYRITDVYVRGALGEAIAMVIIPLFVMGLWEVFFGEKNRYMLLMISAAGLFLSHMISTLLCAGLAAGMFVLFLPKLLRERRLSAIGKAVIGALLLGLFQIVPFLDYSMDGIGAQNIRISMASRAIAPAQLLLMGVGDLPVDPKDPTLSGMPLEIGMALIVGAALALHCVQQEKKKNCRQTIYLFAALSMCFACMSTTLFPWEWISRLTRQIVDYIQFPWRFLTLTTVLLSMVAAYGYVHITGNRGDLGVVLAMSIALFAVMPTIGEQTRSDDYIEYGQSVGPTLGYYGEYTIPGTIPEKTTERDVMTQGGAALTQYKKNGTTITAQVEASEDGAVTLPLFGYDGYRVELDGKEIAWTLGENNRLCVPLEKGMQGELRVLFAGKAVWRAAEAVSLLTALGLLVLCRRRKLQSAA